MERKQHLDAAPLWFAAIRVADVGTTYLFLSRGVAREGNPIWAWVFDNYGLWGLVIGNVTASLWILTLVPHRILLICTGLTAVVFLWNAFAVVSA